MSTTVTISEAQARLAALIDQVGAGESVTIAQDGKPIARLVPVEAPQRPRIGFLEGQIMVPDDFDTMGAEEIRKMFEGEE